MKMTWAERSLLGAILLSSDPKVGVRRVLDADRGAHSPAFGRIFEAMCWLYFRNEALDLESLARSLRRLGDLDELGGLAAVASLVDGVPRYLGIEPYLALVMSASQQNAGAIPAA